MQSLFYISLSYRCNRYYINASLSNSSPPWESNRPFHYIEKTFHSNSIIGLPIAFSNQQNSFDSSSKMSSDDFLFMDRLRVIELGCGASSSATYLASLGSNYDVTAVDISRYALQRAALMYNGDQVKY
jgi:2-polyprenyl-3-methyl-5-hydroxy-6-metoxy-1,4-benzoquinol methylase